MATISDQTGQGVIPARGTKSNWVFIYNNSGDPAVTPGSICFSAPLLNDVSTSVAFAWTGLVDEATVGMITKALSAIKEGSPGAVQAMTPNGGNNVTAGTKLTKMIGGMPDHFGFDIACRLTVENSVEEVYEKIRLLYYICTPKLGKWVANFADKVVSVHVGKYLYIREAAVNNINISHSKTMVAGSPGFVDITMSIKSVRVASEELLSGIYSNRITVTPK